MSQDLIFRPVNPGAKGEFGFVVKSWIRYILDTNAPLIKQYYAEAAARTVNDLFARSRVYVAALAASPDDLFGYVAYEPGKCLHMLYVKASARRMGIGSELLSMALQDLPTPLEYTCRTRQSKPFLKNAKHNPRQVNIK